MIEYCARASSSCIIVVLVCWCPMLSVCAMCRWPAAWRFVPNSWRSGSVTSVSKQPRHVSDGCNATWRGRIRHRALRWPTASVRPTGAWSTRHSYGPSRSSLQPLLRPTTSRPPANTAPAKLAVGASPTGSGSPRRDLVMTSFPRNLVTSGGILMITPPWSLTVRFNCLYVPALRRLLVVPVTLNCRRDVTGQGQRSSSRLLLTVFVVFMCSMRLTSICQYIRVVPTSRRRACEGHKVQTVYILTDLRCLVFVSMALWLCRIRKMGEFDANLIFLCSVFSYPIQSSWRFCLLSIK